MAAVAMETGDANDPRVDAAGARAAASVADQLPAECLDKMNRLDWWLLRQPDMKLARPVWRGKFLRIVDTVSGGELFKED